jgi:two-component system nitrogen regulation response regulator NtrX
MTESPCILIIDDHPDVVEILKQYFEAAGCEVLTGGSGAEGLELARTNQVHAILMDICMPDMNGDDVLAQVKRILPNVPVIMMSGAQQECTARRCLDLGATDFVLKPFDYNYLETSVLTSIMCNTVIRN